MPLLWEAVPNSPMRLPAPPFSAPQKFACPSKTYHFVMLLLTYLPSTFARCHDRKIRNHYFFISIISFWCLTRSWHPRRLMKQWNEYE